MHVPVVFKKGRRGLRKRDLLYIRKRTDPTRKRDEEPTEEAESAGLITDEGDDGASCAGGRSS